MPWSLEESSTWVSGESRMIYCGKLRSICTFLKMSASKMGSQTEKGTAATDEMEPESVFVNAGE